MFIRKYIANFFCLPFSSDYVEVYIFKLFLIFFYFSQSQIRLRMHIRHSVVCAQSFFTPQLIEAFVTN